MITIRELFTTTNNILTHVGDKRFSGGFRKLSKLVVIIVMLRGRHRGLPVAVRIK